MSPARRVSLPQRQRGVALLLALMAVALALLLAASLLERGEQARGRAQTQWRAEQSWQLLIGLEAWAIDILKRDAEASGGIDHPGSAWRQPMPPIEVPGARIAGRLHDLGGCFNLNALHAGGQDDALAIARFERLLRALNLEPGIAAQAADWIDADNEPRRGGAEDAQLAQRMPARRAANRAFVDVTELRALPGVDAAVFERLAPFVCALPSDHRINLNTAAPELWMALHEGIGAGEGRRLAREGQARYASLEAVQQEFERMQLPMVDLRGTDLRTSYVLAEAEIEADGLPFRYRSLIRREVAGGRVLWRR
jgi:general secretion pathway protein K